MNNLHILTPVKDSLESSLRTIQGIMDSKVTVEFSYTVYNDFSSDIATEALTKSSKTLGFTLVNLKEITLHPSPNYLLILQIAQQRANFENAHLLIIESDVIVERDTIQRMYDSVSELENPGVIASVTTDQNHKVNFPYSYAKRIHPGMVNTKKKLRFCCTMLTSSFLTTYNFDSLNPERTWHDQFISQKSLELGFKNYLMTSLPVIHLQNSIYPWSHLKISQPVKYYWNKITGMFSNN